MKFRQSLFWDVDPKTIDPQKHARYIIERVLEFGRDTEVRWINQQYPPAAIKQTIITSRNLSPRTVNFWADYYHIPQKQIKCLSKQSTPAPNKVWPY